MRRIFLKYLEKLYFKHWVLGLCRGDIGEIIRTKAFKQNIQWLSINSTDHHNADPFLTRLKGGSMRIFFEDLALIEQYGKIFSITLDEKLKMESPKLLLDTKSHLSYPFIITEAGRTLVFPEASKSGRLSCYEYDEEKESLTFLQDIIDLPLLDSTILNYNDKYWLFGTINGNDSHNKLYIFYSDSILGPYLSHPANPVKNSLSSSRPAGSFIVVDNIIYRPSQNCEKSYGGSITINKVIRLDEAGFMEEPYMQISIDDKNLQMHNIHTIHTINVIDDIIAVDGQKWTFSPINQWKFHQINRRAFKQSE